MKPWIILFIAGLMEVGWAIGLKSTHGFSRFWPVLFTLIAFCGSLWLLSLAIRDLPLGTAYAVWVGIGIIGTCIYQVATSSSPPKASWLFFLVLLLIAITGLKLTTEASPPNENDHPPELRN